MRIGVVTIILAACLPSMAYAEVKTGPITVEQHQAFRYCQAFMKKFIGSCTLGDYADFFVFDKDGTFIDRGLIKKNGRKLHESPLALDIERDTRDLANISILHIDDSGELGNGKAGVFYLSDNAASLMESADNGTCSADKSKPVGKITVPTGVRIQFEIRDGMCYPADIQTQQPDLTFSSFVHMDDCLRLPPEKLVPIENQIEALKKLRGKEFEAAAAEFKKTKNCIAVPHIKELQQVFKPADDGAINAEGSASPKTNR
jgi:hypothetical protein